MTAKAALGVNPNSLTDFCISCAVNTFLGNVVLHLSELLTAAKSGRWATSQSATLASVAVLSTEVVKGAPSGKRICRRVVALLEVEVKVLGGAGAVDDEASGADLPSRRLLCDQRRERVISMQEEQL